jgi:hypothetical protein
MYSNTPLYRDQSFLCALAATVGFTLFALALGIAGYHFSGGVGIIPALVGWGMAPVIRSYGQDLRDAYRRNHRRNEYARQARARRDARLAA